jgi:hypothetical protein
MKASSINRTYTKKIYYYLAKTSPGIGTIKTGGKPQKKLHENVSPIDYIFEHTQENILEFKK